MPDEKGSRSSSVLHIERKEPDKTKRVCPPNLRPLTVVYFLIGIGLRMGGTQGTQEQEQNPHQDSRVVREERTS